MNCDSIHFSPGVKAFRESILLDPDRPGYHFAVPEALGQPGDPNGAFYADGKYHLMYLYLHPVKGYCWAHLTSLDLFHWRFHKDAIVPGNQAKGCYSGGAFVDDDGKAYITFWDFIVTGTDYGGIRLAVSEPPYEEWEILPEYIVPCKDFQGVGKVQLQEGKSIPVAAADPSNIWKKDGYYYFQAGNLLVLDHFGRSKSASPDWKGDWTDLYRSSDLKKWEYVHRFYKRNKENSWTEETEDDMCPSFLPLPLSQNGGTFSGKYLQLFISHNKGCQYYIGTYDKNNDVFLPETHGRMSWIDSAYFAPEALVDSSGRQIMWAWLRDDPNDVKQRGWSGVFGMPRALWLDPEENALRMAPAPEVKNLRYQKTDFYISELKDETFPLSGFDRLSCEIELQANVAEATQFGVRVRASADGNEYTDIFYDASSHELVLDTRKGTSKGWPAREAAPFLLNENELLRLSVFIDKSVIEVYANDRQALCRRVYPEKKGDEIHIFAHGNVKMYHSCAWSIEPSNAY